jgi:hypothetical protein
MLFIFPLKSLFELILAFKKNDFAISQNSVDQKNKVPKESINAPNLAFYPIVGPWSIFT